MSIIASIINFSDGDSVLSVNRLVPKFSLFHIFCVLFYFFSNKTYCGLGDSELRITEARMPVQCQDQQDDLPPWMRSDFIEKLPSTCYSASADLLLECEEGSAENTGPCSMFPIGATLQQAERAAQFHATLASKVTTAAQNQSVRITDDYVKGKYPELYNLFRGEDFFKRNMVLTDLLLDVCNRLVPEFIKNEHKWYAVSSALEKMRAERKARGGRKVSTEEAELKTRCAAAREEGLLGMRGKSLLYLLFDGYGIQHLALIKERSQMEKALRFLVSKPGAVIIMNDLETSLGAEEVFDQRVHTIDVRLRMIIRSMFIFRKMAGSVFIAIMDQILINPDHMLNVFKIMPTLFVVTALSRHEDTKDLLNLYSVHGDDENKKRTSYNERYDALKRSNTVSDVLFPIQDYLNRIFYQAREDKQSTSGIISHSESEELAYTVIYTLLYGQKLYYDLHKLVFPGSMDTQFSSDFLKKIVQNKMLGNFDGMVLARAILAMTEFPVLQRYVAERGGIDEQWNVSEEQFERLAKGLSNIVDLSFELPGGDREFWHIFKIGLLYADVTLRKEEGTIVNLYINLRRSALSGEKSWFIELVNRWGVFLPSNSNPFYLSSLIQKKFKLRKEPGTHEQWNQFFYEFSESLLKEDIAMFKAEPK